MGKKVAGSLCPKQHPLTQVTNSQPDSWACDKCGGSTAIRFTCEPCDFDLCATCNAAGAEAPAPKAPAPAATSTEYDTPVSAGPHYLKSHSHKLVRAERSYIGSLFTRTWCDVCEEVCGNTFYSCNEAPLDVCEACWRKEIGEHGPLDPVIAQKEADEKAAAALAAAQKEAGATAGAPLAAAPVVMMPTGLPSNVWEIKYQDKSMKLKKFHGLTTEELEKTFRTKFSIKGAHMLLTDSDGVNVVINPNMPAGQSYTVEVLR